MKGNFPGALFHLIGQYVAFSYSSNSGGGAFFFSLPVSTKRSDSLTPISPAVIIHFPHVLLRGDDALCYLLCCQGSVLSTQHGNTLTPVYSAHISILSLPAARFFVDRPRNGDGGTTRSTNPLPVGMLPGWISSRYNLSGSSNSNAELNPPKPDSLFILLQYNQPKLRGKSSTNHASPWSPQDVPPPPDSARMFADPGTALLEFFSGPPFHPFIHIP